MSFERLTSLVRPLEPVAAGVVNRPIRQIDQNAAYLWDVLQAAAVGQTVYARSQTVAAACVVGTPVYYDQAERVFLPALAAVESGAGGALATADSSQVWGVVAVKHHADLADVLLFGYAPLDVSPAVDTGAAAAGTYYLSGLTPGTLTADRPPLAVPVLRVVPGGMVFVAPQWVDFLDRHRHYRFELYAKPAGHTDPPGPGGRHVVADPDPAAPGWLPAGHAAFEGRAPHGAAFGYNLRAHPALDAAWPPLPAAHAYLEMDRGADAAAGLQGVPPGPTGLAVVNRDGIWWMSDCYGDAPWPAEYDGSTGWSLSDSQSASAECPRHLAMRLTLWFTKIAFATDTTVVTSLRSVDDRLVVTCRGTDDPAAAGDLDLDLDLGLTTGDTDRRGRVVFKALEDEKFHAGPVLEGVYALSGTVTLVGDDTVRLTPGDAASPVVYQGIVGLAVDPAPTRELDVQLVRLEGANEELYQDVMYLGFPAGEESRVRLKLHVPADAALPSPRLTVRLRLLGRAAGTLPQLTVTGRRVPRPAAGLATPLDLPLAAAEFDVTVDTAAVLDAANQYAEAEAAAFAVEAGDVVFLTVAREEDDAYPSEVGVLQVVADLAAGA